MSKKITHEQVREGLLQVYIYNDIHTNEANYVLIRDYITQQEKQEKLLELYKKFYNGCTDYHDYDELKEIQKQIKEIER